MNGIRKSALSLVLGSLLKLSFVQSLAADDQSYAEQTARPDYFAVLNQHCGHDVQPQQNAAVLLLGALGTETVPADIRTPYFSLLGTQPPSATGETFVRSDEMIDRWIRGATDFTSSDENDDLHTQFLTCSQQPWSAADYPLVAHWLRLNERPLEIIVAAANREKFYEPLVSVGLDRPSLNTASLPVADCAGEIKLALQARAMLAARDGNADSAWSDLLACHRVLRQMAGLPISRYAVTAHSEELDLCQTELRLLHCTHPSREQVERIQAQWNSLPAAGSLTESIDIGQRYRFLDLIRTLEQHGAVALSQMSSESSMAGDDSTLENAISDPHVRFRDLQQLTSDWFDRLVAISKIASRTDREAALQKMHVELEQMTDESYPRQPGAKSQSKRSVRLAFVAMMQHFDSDLTAAWEAADQSAVHTAFVQTGLALAAYHAEHDRYPKRLEELTPKFARNLPTDVYTDHKSLRYRPAEDGYVLYSVGPNGIDEEAGAADNLPDSDDISIAIGDPPTRTTAEETP